MPLYIFHGNEAFGRREAYRKLKESLDTDGSLATNTVEFEARQSSPQEVMAACDALPFLGGTRLVVVTGILAAFGKSTRGKKKTQVALGDEPDPADSRWAILGEYVDRMPPSTTLVLIDSAAPPGGLITLFKGKGKIESFPLPSDRDLAGWVAHRAKALGVRVDASAARLLAQLIGPDLWALAGELDKLGTYAAGEIVREATVRELVSRAKEHKGYELSDAVLDGQGSKAARIFHELIEDGAVPQVLLSTIAGRYRKVAIARELLDAGESGDAITGAAEVKPGYPTEKLIEQARHHSLKDVRRAYARLIMAETDVKHHSMDYDLAVELAVQELALGPSRR